MSLSWERFVYYSVTGGGLWLSLFLMTGCSNELDVTGKPKDVPVVYGLLNFADSAHYITVTRTFLPQDESALKVAKEPDSLYYENLNVRLMVLRDTQQVIDKINFRQVNGDREGRIREPGVFACHPNTLYKSTHSLSPRYQYRLIIDVPETGQQITTTIPLVDSFDVFNPSNGIKIDWTREWPLTLMWRPAKEGAVYQADAEFYYKEKNIKTGQETVKSFRWLLFRGKEAETGRLSEQIARKQLFRRVDHQLEPNRYVTRQALRIRFIFYAGGHAYHQYTRVQKARQFSIAGTQNTPHYTNLSTGRGIFSSRYKVVVDTTELNFLTHDSLACGRFTKDLNFVGKCD